MAEAKASQYNAHQLLYKQKVEFVDICECIDENHVQLPLHLHGGAKAAREMIPRPFPMLDSTLKELALYIFHVMKTAQNLSSYNNSIFTPEEVIQLTLILILHTSIVPPTHR
ncbi:guanine nucleotide-binding protein G(z) subunit alpha-like [Platysternon megacephalum]|uniref:Guanine nucleotide-binding protein G(Z) subunit alpha-like n=1 Tax=Platysternon megacephalum TaxID=55544 RepID=A0A4D9DY21_9SAUR|nr:guanine nucleotide-binding protein G(z) subunit alpha-like [Platysternon megacephalum]